MIFSIRGKVILINQEASSAVVETKEGIGYEIYLAPSTLRLIPPTAGEINFFISESSSLYGGSGGATTLYGFESLVDREIFELLRSMPSTGAKKALEYLDKIKRSPSEFKNAILLRDTAKLSTLFGFRKPTAEKFIANLRDKIMKMDFSPAETNKYERDINESVKGNFSEGKDDSIFRNSSAPLVSAEVFSETLAVLVALGYKESIARDAIDEALKAIAQSEDKSGKNTIDAQSLVKTALKKL